MPYTVSNTRTAHQQLTYLPQHLIPYQFQFQFRTPCLPKTMASPTDFTPTSIPVPASTDLSAAVSAYIQQHLISTHHMKSTAAYSIAHQQTMHGAELREMNLARHRKLFGDEIAQTLYTEVRTAVLEEELEEHERRDAARPARGAVRSEYQFQASASLI
jgi:hypothetical protein